MESKRKSQRLKDYDYSQNGYYFITICSYNRQNIFGEIESVGQGLGSCRLSQIGDTIQKEWGNLKQRYNDVLFENYIVMPNHFHCIIGLDKCGWQEQSPCPTIGDIICAFKSLTTKICNKNENIFGRKIWQFRFHDRIIRNENEYQKIYEYIQNNPMQWELDCHNPNTRDANTRDGLW